MEVGFLLVREEFHPAGDFDPFEHLEAAEGADMWLRRQVRLYIATRSLVPCIFIFSMIRSASRIEAIAQFAILHLAKSLAAESYEQGLLRTALSLSSLST